MLDMTPPCSTRTAILREADYHACTWAAGRRTFYASNGLTGRTPPGAVQSLDVARRRQGGVVREAAGTSRFDLDLGSGRCYPLTWRWAETSGQRGDSPESWTLGRTSFGGWLRFVVTSYRWRSSVAAGVLRRGLGAAGRCCSSVAGVARRGLRSTDVVVCNTSPLVAAALATDDDHHACVELFTCMHLARRALFVSGDGGGQGRVSAGP